MSGLNSLKTLAIVNFVGHLNNLLNEKLPTIINRSSNDYQKYIMLASKTEMCE